MSEQVLIRPEMWDPVGLAVDPKYENPMINRVAPDIRPAGYPAFFDIRYPAGYPVSFAGYPARKTLHGISFFKT